MKFLIAHAPWLPDRRETLLRLREQLGNAWVEAISSRGREHAVIWARRVWERAAQMDDHVCILNDDVILQPGFHETLERMVVAVPDEPISLHCTNPHAMPYAEAGHAWVRCYHYTGPAVVLPPGAAQSLCEYVYTLPWSILSRTNEDNIACMWAWDRQRPFWYALPAPVTHDTAVPSSLGYDDHPFRTPVVLDGPEPDWTVTDKWSVPFVQLDWMHTKKLDLTRHVLRAGRHMCTMCLAREGTVGNLREGMMLCNTCVREIYSAAIRGAREQAARNL